MPRGEPVPSWLRSTQRTAAVEAYGRGKTVRELASDFGVSYGSMHKLLAEAGVLRGRGRIPGNVYPAPRPRRTPGIDPQSLPPRRTKRENVDDELREHLAPRSDDE
jgi:hypothetical protein